MADKISASEARDGAHRRIEHVRATLAANAKMLAEETARYAARIANDEPDMGEGRRIAQSALELAVRAASLDGMTEVSAYLDAVAGDDTKEA